MHAGGNLLKVKVDGSDPPRYRLAYLDYGIVSYVPSQVRDGLVCAVAALVFAGDTAAVADLFGELQLIPQHVLDDPSERQALQDAMKISLADRSNILILLKREKQQCQFYSLTSCWTLCPD